MRRERNSNDVAHEAYRLGRDRGAARDRRRQGSAGAFHPHEEPEEEAAEDDGPDEVARSHGYFATPLSANIARTPEGFCVCRDAVLCRTGFQKYRVGDIDGKLWGDVGVSSSNPEQRIDLYRDEQEVFAPAFLASLEGKPIVDNHPPNMTFVTPENYDKLAMGHVQNVHRGAAPLDSGDWPLLGDLVIAREPLLSAITKGQKRELSVGYDFKLARDGNRLCQTEMKGNHVAVVPQGRGGHEVRIVDAASVVFSLRNAQHQSRAQHDQVKSALNKLFRGM